MLSVPAKLADTETAEPEALLNVYEGAVKVPLPVMDPPVIVRAPTASVRPLVFKAPPLIVMAPVLGIALLMPIVKTPFVTVVPPV